MIYICHRLPIAIVLLSTSILAGCQTLGGDASLTSYAPSDISQPAAESIAGDMVSRLAEQFGPGSATIAVKQDGSLFGDALGAALKGWGYAVVTDQKTDATVRVVPLSYVISPFEDQILAQLSSDSFSIGRAYTLSAAGAVPASPISIMSRD
ncbi:conjugal transfer protein TrbH [Mesorhizobium sp. SB112]|uniref:conjugal transfer protein TrbH n=1 Tax=Mesorhizobium sp. SB112 TaxID=3151853 RepID=UPI0032658178